MPRILEIAGPAIRHHLPGQSPNIARRSTHSARILQACISQHAGVTDIDVIVVIGPLVDVPVYLRDDIFWSRHGDSTTPVNNDERSNETFSFTQDNLKKAALLDYRLVRTILEQAKVPVFVIPGESDDPALFEQVFENVRQEDPIGSHTILGTNFLKFKSCVLASYRDYIHSWRSHATAPHGGKIESSHVSRFGLTGNARPYMVAPRRIDHEHHLTELLTQRNHQDVDALHEKFDRRRTSSTSSDYIKAVMDSSTNTSDWSVSLPQVHIQRWQLDVSANAQAIVQSTNPMKSTKSGTKPSSAGVSVQNSNTTSHAVVGAPTSQLSSDPYVQKRHLTSWWKHPLVCSDSFDSYYERTAILDAIKQGRAPSTILLSADTFGEFDAGVLQQLWRKAKQGQHAANAAHVSDSNSGWFTRFLSNTKKKLGSETIMHTNNNCSCLSSTSDISAPKHLDEFSLKWMVLDQTQLSNKTTLQLTVPEVSVWPHCVAVHSLFDQVQDKGRFELRSTTTLLGLSDFPPPAEIIQSSVSSNTSQNITQMFDNVKKSMDTKEKVVDTTESAVKTAESTLSPSVAPEPPSFSFAKPRIVHMKSSKQIKPYTLPLVLLDRDGVLNQQSAYRTGSRPLQLVPGAGRAIRSLHESGFRVGVISTQSCIGSGWVTEEMVQAVMDKLCCLMRLEGIQDGVPDTMLRLYEPDVITYSAGSGSYDDPDAQAYRDISDAKPSPTLPLLAGRILGYDLILPSNSSASFLSKGFIVGDRVSDLHTALNCGCTPILVRTGVGESSVCKLDNVHKVDVLGDGFGSVYGGELSGSRVLIVRDVSAASKLIIRMVFGNENK